MQNNDISSHIGCLCGLQTLALRSLKHPNLMKLLLPVLLMCFVCFQALAQESQTDTSKIFLLVDVAPTYEGGMEALYKEFAQKIQYPKMARRIGIEGRVFIQFVIRKDGSVSDVSILKAIGLGCDEEAIRVVKEATHWKPGLIQDKPVHTRMSIPIFFKLGGSPENPLIIVNGKFLGRLNELRDYFAKIKEEDIIAVKDIKELKELKNYDKKAVEGEVGLMIEIAEK